MHAIAFVKASGFGLLIGAALLLSGCSETRETRAAKACVKEFESKIEKDRPYLADIKKIAATAKADGTDMLDNDSEITLDSAQANQSKQEFTCRVQFDPAKPDAEPTVILLQFAF